MTKKMTKYPILLLSLCVVPIFSCFSVSCSQEKKSNVDVEKNNGNKMETNILNEDNVSKIGEQLCELHNKTQNVLTINFLANNNSVVTNDKKDVMKKIIKENIIFNDETLHHKFLSKEKINEIENIAIDVIYEVFVEEIKSINPNARHGVGFGSKHSGETIRLRVQVAALNCGCAADIGLQIILPIVAAVAAKDPSVFTENIATFEGKISSISQYFIERTIKDIIVFRDYGKCNDKFYLGGELI